MFNLIPAQCTFYNVYSACIQSSFPSDHQTALCEALVELVSGVVALHKGGSTFLLEADCLCSEEVSYIYSKPGI